ncbi:MAG: hypothetical protein F2893_03870 [Actinobacteria bacterium]|uniref:Unannotated protein n=1 Tax=freshwater metagenome TaxID=449393 RepID=A0A6J7PQ67_9ZZZZ|nr:hypothetical protein [Actinomycetota bacterium]
MRFKSLLLSLIILFSSTLVVPPATAGTKGWRYWGYFQAAPSKTTWTAAMTGPTVDVADGSVEGWSFVFSSDDIPSKAPSIKPNFKSICGKTKADPDTKRVGLVIEYGSASYAPAGEKIKKTVVTCVRVAKESLGIDVLGQIVKIRASSSGLICGINGFPAKECGVEINTPTAMKTKK